MGVSTLVRFYTSTVFFL